MKPKGGASGPILQVHPHFPMFFVDDTGHEQFCYEPPHESGAAHLHQTTNLGVRSSNLFGRANKIRYLREWNVSWEIPRGQPRDIADHRIDATIDSFPGCRQA